MCVTSSATYGKLPPLNPDDLKLPPPPPSAADKVTNHADAISLSEVWEEIKAKTRAMYVVTPLWMSRGTGLGLVQEIAHWTLL